MITQIWSQIHQWMIRFRFAVTRVEDFSATGHRIEPHHSRTRDRRSSQGQSGLLARWRARLRSQAELDALTDATRADLGLAPKSPQWQDELRFIARPDRFGITVPGLTQRSEHPVPSCERRDADRVYPRFREATTMSEMTARHALYYTDDLVMNLQLRWGDGFLSPGGGDELARMLQDVEVTGEVGLDVGCAVGGYDVLLVRDHGAARVVGIDLDQTMVEEARQRARYAGLADRLEFLAVEPGPTPFADDSFGFVFTKDTIADIPLAQKPAVFVEMHRACRPGGWLIVSDWFRGEAPYTEEMRKWATEGDETYELETLAQTARYARDAGFVELELDDRNDWFRSYAQDEYERLKGPLYPVYVDRFGEEAARTSVENARIRALLAEQGQLRPGHIRARKPAA